MRILVFGTTGQLARELLRRAPEGVAVQAVGRDTADLTDPAACAAAVAATDADLILNAAAYTAVDQAETDRATADLVNGEAPGAMARAAAARGLPFLHVSTDYVFDGSGTRPWSEGDPVAPLGAYGASKLLGEHRVAEAGGQAVILRTAWVFSAHGKNFVKTMLRVGAEREVLSVVDDQRGGPTAATDIADALFTIAAAFGKGRGVPGIYHFAGAPTVSWADFAEAIFAASSLPRKPVVNRIPSSDYPTPAKRPGNSALDCSLLVKTYGITQPDWRKSLADVIGELEAEA
ncbi:dTDP-4-dehydrorhamnose reductase [Defluviimonas denitrificans]|jgi:dTDP-4-dehydrorhamnose reductase|uniref:dTDP-4-dehydrorhamnose reductase n=1 Tax=Albidovulum denitrificans TaxID=404881 RepID=A0A2S8S9F4_9RHOB|nr:dTDP-4-dehydrorhamnose reductase [Defluviimonas denitrificans]PQV57461.1 dTDP-4-dehydrorhamnose reductase [Defluviimonas denitrificans]